MRRTKRQRDTESSLSRSQPLRASAALVHPDASFRPQLLGTNRNTPLTGKALAQYYYLLDKEHVTRPSASPAPVGPRLGESGDQEEEAGSDVSMGFNDMGGMEPDDYPVQEEEEEVGGLLGSFLPGVLFDKVKRVGQRTRYGIELEERVQRRFSIPFIGQSLHRCTGKCPFESGSCRDMVFIEIGQQTIINHSFCGCYPEWT